MTMSTRGYVILATARSGSNNLCSLLDATGRMGHPAELLNDITDAELARTGSTEALWQLLLSRGSSENGVFGVKTFVDQLIRFRDTGIQDRLLSLPVVYLSRHDKLGQAISFTKAAQTKRWRATSDGDGASSRYDYDMIALHLNRILYHEASYERMFAMRGIVPLRLIYEDYVRDPQHSVATVGALVGEHDFTPASSAALRIQRNSDTDEWRERFLATARARNDLEIFRMMDGWSKIGTRLRRAMRHLPARLRPMQPDPSH